MCIAKLDAKGTRGIDAGVHASEDEVFLCGREGEVAFGERGRVAGRGGFNVLLDGCHGVQVCFASSDGAERV
jgi:hypothetical protein